MFVNSASKYCTSGSAPTWQDKAERAQRGPAVSQRRFVSANTFHAHDSFNACVIHMYSQHLPSVGAELG